LKKLIFRFRKARFSIDRNGEQAEMQKQEKLKFNGSLTEF